MIPVSIPNRLMTVREYDNLFKKGILRPRERVELIEGEIIRMAPMGTRHAEAMVNANEALVLAFLATHRIACQIDVQLGEYSRPEPDFSVLRRDLPLAAAFQQADLVVEVSNTTLAYDRGKKFSLYAKFNIPEYWIVNVRHRKLEVYRTPGPMPKAVFGHGYRDSVKLGEDETVSPLCRPDLKLPVRQLF